LRYPVDPIFAHGARLALAVALAITVVAVPLAWEGGSVPDEVDSPVPVGGNEVAANARVPIAPSWPALMQAMKQEVTAPRGPGAGAESAVVSGAGVSGDGAAARGGDERPARLKSLQLVAIEARDGVCVAIFHDTERDESIRVQAGDRIGGLVVTQVDAQGVEFGGGKSPHRIVRLESEKEATQ